MIIYQWSDHSFSVLFHRVPSFFLQEGPPCCIVLHWKKAQFDRNWIVYSLYSSKTENCHPLSLEKWFVFLQMMPLNRAKYQNIFIQMIKSYKYTKFREVNFKILAQVLISPSLLALIRKNPALHSYTWCAGIANLEHILFSCPQMKSFKKVFVMKNIKLLQKAPKDKH